MHFAPCTPLRCPRFVLQLMQMRQVCPRIATIRQRCSRPVNSRQSIAHKQLVQVVTVCRDNDCVVSPNRAASERTPPARVGREWFCKRPLCELACFVAYLKHRVSTDSKVCGLLRDPVCINALLLRCIDKVEPKNHLFLVCAKGRGSCLRRSIVVTCKRSRRVAGKAERVERFGLSRPAAPALPSRKRGLVEFSHLRSSHTRTGEAIFPATLHGRFIR